MAKITNTGYDFDDVLIVPRYNKVLSRNDVNFSTRLTINYNLDIPFISANMDTITESAMAIAMRNLGGLGVVHRFLSIENQVKQIENISFG